MIRSRRSRPDRRPGIGLLDMMVTMAVVLVFLGLGAGLIRLLLRLDRSSRDGLEAASALTALARDFRLDAHRAAADTAPARDGLSVALTQPGGQVVTYSVRPRDVLRERRQGDRLLGCDLYRLAPRATARFELPPREGHPLLALVVQTPSVSGSKPTSGQPARIVAELGRWAIPADGRAP